ncbi:MAG: OmpP1/FadL family transporter [Flavisolibacter sp.]
MKKIIVLLSVSLPFLVHAQGFQVSLQGQKQQAMAGTGTALMQDGAALYYNPGGVSFLKQNSFSAGVSPVLSHGQFMDEGSKSVSETTSPVSFPFTGYLVMGKKESHLRFGLAAYTPFGSTIDWQNGWSGRFILTHLQLQSVFIQPTISYKISNKLGIGAGFVYGIGNVNLQKDLPLVDNNGNYGHAELSGNAQGYGFNAGLYYAPAKNFSVGLTYHSDVKMDLKKGQANFTVPASLSSSFPSGDFSTSLPLPNIISLGFAYMPSKKLTMALDVNRIGWKSFDTLTFDYAQNTPQLQDTKDVRNYRDAYAFRLGMSYMMSDKLDARMGIKYLVTPVQDGYVSPDVPDATHFNYSAGFGYKFSNRFVLDASFTFEKMKRTDSNTQTGLTGTYNTNLYIPGISFTYNF